MTGIRCEFVVVTLGPLDQRMSERRNGMSVLPAVPAKGDTLYIDDVPHVVHECVWSVKVSATWPIADMRASSPEYAPLCAIYIRELPR